MTFPSGSVDRLAQYFSRVCPRSRTNSEKNPTGMLTNKEASFGAAQESVAHRRRRSRTGNLCACRWSLCRSQQVASELWPVESIADTPYGMRGIGEIASFDLEGERLRAHMFGVAAADWPVVSPDGRAHSTKGCRRSTSSSSNFAEGAPDLPMVRYFAPDFGPWFRPGDTGDKQSRAVRSRLLTR